MKNIKDIFDAATRAGGVRATVDRFDDRFDNMTHDNSFNWCDDYLYPIFEVRHDKTKNIYFIWIAANQDCDPRCDTYLDENCIIFLDEYDFYDFIDAIKTEVNE